MSVIVREYAGRDIGAMMEIWNEVVEGGVAFPQTEALTRETAVGFFASQSFTGVAVEQDADEPVGLYILHPNNVGRCGHISNASYAVRPALRGRHIGEALVRHSMETGKRLGFRILQFNAVVRTNAGAIHLYEKLGFVKLGVIPGGFLMKDGRYEDIVPFYRLL